MVDIRIDLIGCISAYHMLHRLLTTWVELHIRVHFEDPALENDHMFALCNLTFNVPAAQDGVLAGRSEGCTPHALLVTDTLCRM